MLYKKYFPVLTSIILIAILAIGFAVARAIGVLGPSNLRWLLPLSFCLMALLPWILLTKAGRGEIGLKRPNDKSLYLVGIGLGMAASSVCFLSGYLIYGHTTDNWYFNIGNNYKAMMNTGGMSFWMLHLIFTVPAMIFSPIGEEIFFRGVLQKTLEQKWSFAVSTFIECALFGLVHLCHHGFVKTRADLVFLPVSAALWVVQMFFVAWMFAWLRKKSGSIFVSILSHSMFNLTMNCWIFGVLW